MEIAPSLPGASNLEPILDDYRRHHHLSEQVVLTMLIGALAAGRAQALVALEDGRSVGGVVLSRAGGQGKIHLLHARAGTDGVEEALLDRAEEELARGGGLEQISATLALLSDSSLEEVFGRRGYQVLSRARLVLDLAGAAAPADFTPKEPALPRRYRLGPWQADLAEEAAALIEAAHRDSPDTELYPELGGIAGAHLLLERLLSGYFGRFTPAHSFVLRTGPSLVGLCLSVWHKGLPQHGFIVDLCVDAAHRRRGLGRALVLATARAFHQAGAQGLALAVTLSNRPALALYLGMGFRLEQRFSVFRRSMPTPAASG